MSSLAASEADRAQPRWFLADQGRALGPFGAEEIARRLAESGGPLPVWRDGFAQWVDAKSLPEFCPAAPKPAPKPARDLKARLKHEVFEFLRIAGYLWVCLGALTIFKAAVLRDVGVAFAPFGAALVKAMILAKFIMLIEALKIDEKLRRFEALALVVAQKAAAFTILLFVLNLVEELLVGHLHGRTTSEILGELAGGNAAEMAAVCLLMFLIMIPFFAFREAGINFWARATSRGGAIS